ncbi:flavin reductase family protein [Halobacterium litoreum]|uniref:Flavin reductase family protein n=1 Tax=Halobacterium litoreum TaxID=2039234 RepID=A0ABD5NB30_9EURY|nr:flavin reductase family protein [Halobacterium litoreum]UHH14642.1 flavin reductase family protein [Halobacterium litoreum]
MTDPDDFRRVMGQFATGVTVVTFPPADDPHGITVNAFASASLDPPLVLVCLDHDTRSHELLASGDADAFCVNVLAADQQPVGEHFAGMTDLDEPFAGTHAASTGAPVFESALAYVDCTVHSSLAVGDHTVYVGEAADADVLDDTADPLTFFRGEWGGRPR